MNEALKTLQVRRLSCAYRPLLNQEVLITMRTIVFILAFVAFGFSNADACSPLQISVAGDMALVSSYNEICGLSLNLPAGGNRAVTGIDIGFMSAAGRVKGIQANLLLNFTGLSDSYATGVSGIQIAGLANMFMGASAQGVQIAGLFNSGGAGGVQVAGFANSGMYNEVQISLINTVEKGAYVVQLGLLNTADDMTGLQCFGVYNRADRVSGMQIGLVNRTADPLQGVDPKIRMMAGARGSNMNGIQLGAVNLADSMTGAQLGLVNQSRSVQGVQIGLVNIADQLQGIQIGALNIVTSGPVPFLPIANAHF